MFLREAINNGAKPLRAARVPRASAAFVRVQKPSESVGDRFARIQIIAPGLRWPMWFRSIEEPYRHLARLHLFPVEQTTISQRQVPFRQIHDIGIDATVAQSRRSRTLIRFDEFVPFLRVSIGPFRR